MTDNSNVDDGSPARRVIAAFGGIRPMAGKLGVAVTTVQGWKERGTIPAARRSEIEAAARRHDIVLSDSDLETMSETVVIVDATPEAPDPASAAADMPRRSAKTPPPPPRKSPPPARRRAPFIWAVVALILIAAGVIAIAEWVTRAPGPETADAPPAESPAAPALESPLPVPAPVPVDDRFAALVARIEALEADDATPLATDSLAAIESRIADLEQRPAGDVPVGALETQIETLANDLSAVESAVAALDQRLAALPSDAAGPPADFTPIAETLARLEQRIDGIEAAAQARPSTTDSSVSTPGDSLALISLQRIGRALDRGAPFVTEVETLDSWLGDAAPSEAIQILRIHAADGVATLDELSSGFPSPSPEESIDAADGERNFWDTAWDQLTNLVSVRRIETEAGAADDASLLAAAEKALARGNVAMALATAQRIESDAVAGLDGWIAMAASRVSCEAALDEVEGAVLAASRVGAASGE